MSEEIEVNGRKFRQKEDSGWKWFSFIKKAKDIIFNDSSNMQKLSAIKGLTTSTYVEEPGYAMDASAFSKLKHEADTGKRVLISAVNAKGIPTDDEASFETIKANILKIPALGSLSDIQPKKITYKYHHHILPNGTCSCGNKDPLVSTCSGAAAYSTTSGGCYTKYQQVGTHQETVTYSGHNTETKSNGQSGDDKRYICYCKNCGLSYTTSTGSYATSSRANTRFWENYGSTPCKTTATVPTMGYVPDCGLTEGQIQFAIIDW